MHEIFASGQWKDRLSRRASPDICREELLRRWQRFASLGASLPVSTVAESLA
jgi:hypothetical protein